MKKSKSVSISKKKSRSPSSESRKGKRVKSSPPAKEKAKIKKEKGKVPRKSRWGDPKISDLNEAAEKGKISDPIVAVKTETASLEDSARVKNLLNDKEKLVGELFLTITGAALEEIIPDYLKKRSSEELKKLCLEELKKMSDDLILDVISGKQPSLLTAKETSPETLIESKETSVPDKNIHENDGVDNRSDNISGVANTDVLELCAPPNEVSSVADDGNQASEEILEEVAKDLGVSEGDAELLELEMRARAIRSLLKLKSNDESDSEMTNLMDD